jgi:hypothetical protein
MPCTRAYFMEIRNNVRKRRLAGWGARIRTSKSRFLEARGKAFELTREFLAGLERLRFRDFAACLRANRAISDAQAQCPGCEESNRSQDAPALKFGN